MEIYSIGRRSIQNSCNVLGTWQIVDHVYIGRQIHSELIARRVHGNTSFFLYTPLFCQMLEQCRWPNGPHGNVIVDKDLIVERRVHQTWNIGSREKGVGA